MRLEEGLDHVCSGIIMADGSGEIKYINSAALGFLGLEGKSGIGHNVADILPQISDIWTDGFQARGAVGQIDVKTAEGALIVYCREMRSGTQRNGFVITINHKGSNANKANAVEGHPGEARAQQGSSAELAEAKKLCQELQDIFDNSYDEIFVTDGNGVVVRVNRVCEDYYGVTEEELTGKHVSELERLNFFSPSLVPQVLRDRKRVTAVQTVKNGHKIIVTANPVFDETGQITRIVCNSRNITELVNLRQRLEDTEKLAETYREEIDALRNAQSPGHCIIAESLSMRQILETADRVALVDSPVLLEGEPGVGKGIMALRIHRASRRGQGPFIVVNCGAIPENLLESELFGHVSGALAGVCREAKTGLLTSARGGTIFLDEISELPLGLQVKILHAIKEGKVLPVGGSVYQKVDVRIIAATSKDLFKLVGDGRFREDLFYRLNVLPLIIPPLRHRQEDILPLVNCFVKKINHQLGSRKSIHPEVLKALTAYGWPGNVRELQNLVERIMITSGSSEVGSADLPEHLLQVIPGNRKQVMVLDLCPIKDAVEQIEQQLLEKAYHKHKNTYQMAKELGINQSTVVRKMQKYQSKGLKI